MSCFKPVTAWRSAEVNPSGKRSLVFSPDGGFGLPLQIPCGHCIGCRIQRSRDWAVRLMHEAQFHDERCFLTLTYADEFLPADGSLQVPDVQRFFKRLRMALHKGRGVGAWSPAIPDRRVRYLAVGEYGEQLGRPHYHALLFGVDFREDRRPYGVSRNGEHRRYRSERLNAIWKLGIAEIGSLTHASAAYCARYSLKKVYGDLAEAHYQGRTPEFLVCSKGIGSEWFEKFHATDLRGDFCVWKGQKVRVPPYYDKLLGVKESEAYLADVKAKRKAKALTRWRDNTPERLEVREEVFKARVKSLRRS